MRGKSLDRLAAAFRGLPIPVIGRISDGTLYFTDPPFGLPKFFDDKRKELPFSGVFAAKDGKLQLVSKDFTGPNGITFSPDEKYLYANGSRDMSADIAPGMTDGMKVNTLGNMYSSGRGGIWIITRLLQRDESL